MEIILNMKVLFILADLNFVKLSIENTTQLKVFCSISDYTNTLSSFIQTYLNFTLPELFCQVQFLGNRVLFPD